MSKNRVTVGVWVAGTAVCGLVSYLSGRYKQRARAAQTPAAEAEGTMPFSAEDCDAFLLDLLDTRPDAPAAYLGGLREAVLLQAVERRYGKGSPDFFLHYVRVALYLLSNEKLVRKTDTPAGAIWSSIRAKNEAEAAPDCWKERALAAYQAAAARRKERTSGKDQHQWML